MNRLTFILLIGHLQLLFAAGAFPREAFQAAAGESSGLSVLGPSIGSTTVTFRDACSHEPIHVATPNGIELEVKVTGLASDQPIRLTLDLQRPNYPRKTSFDGMGKKVIKLRPKRGEAVYRRRVRTPRNPGRDVIGSFLLTTAQAFWHEDAQQFGPGTVWGSGRTGVRVPVDMKESLYLALGGVERTWHDEVAIASEYIRNVQNVPLAVYSNQHNLFEETQVKRGNFGPSVKVLSLFFDRTTPQPGLLFAGAYFEVTRDYSSSKHVDVGVARVWELGRYQGGYFVTGQSVEWLPVQEYTLVREGRMGCWRWEAGMRGHLERRTPFLDFVIVPGDEALPSERGLHYIKRFWTGEPSAPAYARPDRVLRDGSKFFFERLL